MNNNPILETLKAQPLSEEEKSKRHILGRLCGLIATCSTGTRNGRMYNCDLWNKALTDDIFKEKVKNKSLFLELGHPTDRVETDMEKVCACIPEMPKIINDNLYAYIDILDTNNGRLLKTLCDYGFVPGISSRGSGDILPNNMVDPDTFFLETWDIVQLPAIKEARLQMCENYDPKKATLQQKLAESYEKASEKDKTSMTEALNNLDIEFDVEKTDTKKKDELSSEDIPWVDEETPLLEKADNEKLEDDTIEEFDPSQLETGESEEEENPEEELADFKDKIEEDEPEEGKVEVIKSKEESEEDAEEDTEEAAEEDAEEGSKESEEDIEEESKEDANEGTELTVDSFVNELSGYDKALEVEFAPITIDDVTYKAENICFDDSEKDKLIITLDYSQEIGNDIEVVEQDKTETSEADPAAATDTGAEEMIKSLKEAVRQKNLLTEKINLFKEEKTVHEMEVKALKENLSKYKDAFARTSTLAADAIKVKSQLKQLTEQLNLKTKEVELLKQKQTTELTESNNAATMQIETLKNRLISVRKEQAQECAELTEQITAQKKELKNTASVALGYKNKCNEVLNKYLNFRASMLGVKSTDITNRLSENYSIEDIEQVCNSMLTESIHINRLPYGVDRESKIKISEAQTSKVSTKEGYEIDDSLLELAGLK